MIAPPGSPMTPFLRAATIAVGEKGIHLRAMERIKLKTRFTFLICFFFLWA